MMLTSFFATIFITVSKNEYEEFFNLRNFIFTPKCFYGDVTLCTSESMDDGVNDEGVWLW